MLETRAKVGGSTLPELITLSLGGDDCPRLLYSLSLVGHPHQQLAVGHCDGGIYGLEINTR